ncbi:TPA: hypothetical protein HA238_04960 [Candidatus Micrarchaeota archaeon]|nr:hypothetical protein [Candidatus Micrarchaeota archaeon]
MAGPVTREKGITEETSFGTRECETALLDAAKKLGFGFTFPQELRKKIADEVTNGSGYSFNIPVTNEKQVKAFVAEIEKSICTKIRAGLKEDEGEYIRVEMKQKQNSYTISIDRTRPRNALAFEEK